jgi:hypothetical protein
MAAITLPTISGYGNYSGSNYGVNCMFVEVGPLEVWYSYRTAIAFRVHGNIVIRENEWGPTTGKHLNWIDSDKSVRVSGVDFQSEWDRQVEPLLKEAPAEASPFAVNALTG